MPLTRKPTGAPTPEVAASARGLRDGTPDERWSAARRLTESTDVGALSDALAAEPDARVREAILTSLARIGDRASAEAVIPFLRSDDASLRTAAVDALRMMPQAVAARLPDLLADPDADVRLLACELARALAGPEGSRLLCDLLGREAEVNVCAAAIDVLAEVGDAEALAPLQACAARFVDAPFLVFAIQVASDRIRTQPDQRLG